MSSGRGDFRDQSLGPQGEVPFQMRNTGTYIEGALFLAGNKICYPGEWGSLEEVSIRRNSTIVGIIDRFV